MGDSESPEDLIIWHSSQRLCVPFVIRILRTRRDEIGVGWDETGRDGAGMDWMGWDVELNLERAG